MKQIVTQIKENESFLKREDYQKELLRKLAAVKETVKEGGGKKAIEKHKAKGKLTARERINLLVDDPKKFFELSTFAVLMFISEKEIDLNISIPENPPRVKCDIEKTVWVLVNLLSNAIRYSPIKSKVYIQINISNGFVIFSSQSLYGRQPTSVIAIISFLAFPIAIFLPSDLEQLL